MASIDKRPDGRYRARWREYPGGPQKTRQLVRKRDADRFLDAIRGDLAYGVYVDPAGGRTLFEDYAEQWRAAQVHRARRPPDSRPTCACMPTHRSVAGPWAPSAAARSRRG